MKLFYTPFLTLCFLIISTFSFSNQKTDSLETALQNSDNQEKIKIYQELIQINTRSNPDQAILYSESMIAFADSIKNTDGLALANRLLALVYEYQHRYDLSLEIWKINVEIEKELKNLKNQAYSTMNIGSCLQHLSRYDEALFYFGEAQKILEEINDLRGLGFNYSNLGIVYEKKGMPAKALEYKLIGLQNAEKLADSSNIAYCYNSIAVCLTNMHEFQQAVDNYTRAIEIYKVIGKSHNAVHALANLGVTYNSLQQKQKAMEAFRKGLILSKSIKYKYGEAIVQMNLGEVLLKNSQADSAMYYIEESNLTFLELKDPHPLCYNYKLMGKYYKASGNLTQALDYLTKTYNLSQEIEAPDMHRDAALNLSEIYELSGDYKKALLYQKIFKQYSDSLFNAENVAETTRLHDQYLFEKEAEKTALIHQAELSRKQAILITLISGLLVVSILLLLLFAEYRRKNAAYKALYRKNMELVKNSGNKKNNVALKNGDLFIEIERLMREEKFFKQKTLSRDTFKELLNTNHEYIQQAIKDHAGKTVSEYIASYRVAEAMKLLSKPEMLKGKTLLAIPDEVGLKSQSTFYRLFKDETGMTPLQFQKQAEK